MKKSTIGASLVTLLLLGALITASDSAVHGATAGLHTCGTVIIPCLLPFFTLSYLAGNLGLPVYLGQTLHKPMSILFGTSGTGASIFVLSVLGGYPLGAAIIADHVQRGDLSPQEGSKLLAFCNNSGPAFLIGAAGIGIFHSAFAGILLYAVHVLSALITGLFLSGTHLPNQDASPVHIASVNLSTALPDAISKAALQLLQICGYVVFFGAVIGILEETGLFTALYGTIATFTPLSLSLSRALCMGLVELGCGIGALKGCPLTPQALTVCSLLMGFGGISVCLQTAGVLSGTTIKLRHHILGRIFCSGISGFLMYTISSILL